MTLLRPGLGAHVLCEQRPHMVQRLPAQVGEPLHRHETAFTHDADPVGYALNLAEDVGRQQDAPPVLRMLAQEGMELTLHEGITGWSERTESTERTESNDGIGPVSGQQLPDRRVEGLLDGAC